MVWPGRNENKRDWRAGMLELLVKTVDKSHEGEFCEDLSDLPGSIHENNDGEGKLLVAHGPPGVLEHEWTFATERRWQKRPGARLGAQNCFVDRSARVPRAKPAAFVFHARCASPRQFLPQISRRPMPRRGSSRCWHIAPAIGVANTAALIYLNELPTPPSTPSASQSFARVAAPRLQFLSNEVGLLELLAELRLPPNQQSGRVNNRAQPSANNWHIAPTAPTLAPRPPVGRVFSREGRVRRFGHGRPLGGFLRFRSTFLL